VSDPNNPLESTPLLSAQVVPSNPAYYPLFFPPPAEIPLWRDRFTSCTAETGQVGLFPPCLVFSVPGWLFKQFNLFLYPVLRDFLFFSLQFFRFYFSQFSKQIISGSSPVYSFLIVLEDTVGKPARADFSVEVPFTLDVFRVRSPSVLPSCF